MAGLAAFCELAIMRVIVAFRAISGNAVKGEFGLSSGILLRHVTFFAGRIGMFAFEPEFAVAVMDKKQIGFLPAAKSMAFRTISRLCFFVRIRMAIRTGSKVQANVSGALMHASAAISKVALVTRHLAMLSIKPEPGEIMIERRSIELADVTILSKMFRVTIPAWTTERPVITNAIRCDLADILMAFEASL